MQKYINEKGGSVSIPLENSRSLLANLIYLIFLYSLSH